jgi:serine/threonine protein kinase
VHRDIKPANIMLTRRHGVGDFAKLLDFGLVKAQDTRQQTMLTATDMITGTPLYMSPESIQDPEHVDGRGDLYALGAVAYFLLTGRPVFEANNVIEIIRRHVESKPVPPSEVSKTPIAPELERLIMSCLEKSADKRPATAAAMVEALQRAVPLQPWTSADAERWWLQNDPAGDGPAATVTAQIDASATVQYSGKTTAT